MNRKQRRIAAKQERRAGGETTSGRVSAVADAGRVGVSLLDHALHLHRAGDLTRAEGTYRRILADRPDDPSALNLLGVLVHQCGRHPEAATLIGRALELSPDYAAAHNNLGNVLRCLGDLEAAVASFRQAIHCAPDFSEAYNNLGGVLLDMRRYEAAELACREAIRRLPGEATAYFNLGNLLRDRNRLDEAEGAYREALRLQPGYAEAHNNLGGVLVSRQCYDQAEAAYRAALRLRPGDAKTHYNLGTLLKGIQRLTEAEVALREALRLQPDSTEAAQNLGLLLLVRGEFAAGWPLYERAFHAGELSRTSPVADLTIPYWRGEDLTGRALLVLGEQGFGDEIQFCRYVPLLKARGARQVTLVCKGALAGVLATLPGVDRVVAFEQWSSVRESLPTHDFWSFVLALPLYCGTTLSTIPARLPYLFPLPERVAVWAERMPAQGKRVGLVWRGHATHKFDHHRSLPDPTLLAPLWSLPGIAMVSLQAGGSGEVTALASRGYPMLDLGSEIREFADTAAIIAQLDLVISVDTAVVHLCGALGRSCWVMLPFVESDWRWLEQRDDSPWYPGIMRLFRQQNVHDWPGVMARITAALRIELLGAGAA
ncbi:MAG: glycosyltransferase family protein [Magnetococcales bacterium]|nr:glycosyltransferase family protein [Magnetococcales bacterium]